MTLFTKAFLVSGASHSNHHYLIPLLGVTIFLLACIVDRFKLRGASWKREIVIDFILLVSLLTFGTLCVTKEIRNEALLAQSEQVIKQYVPSTYSDLPMTLAMAQEQNDMIMWKPNTPHDLPIALELGIR